MNTDEEKTLYVGNLDSQVDEALLYELFLQFAPVHNVRMPRDRVSGKPQGFAFVCLDNEKDLPYVLKVLNGISVYNKTMKVRRINRDKKTTSSVWCVMCDAVQ